MFGNLLRNVSIAGLLGLLVSVATVGVALVYAIRPNEQRLALMRPLSLAAIFGGLSTFTLGITNVLRGIAENQQLTPENWRIVAVGTAESFVGLVVAFGCLTIAWLLVTLGLRRT
jgi:hypothetical protein